MTESRFRDLAIGRYTARVNFNIYFELVVIFNAFHVYVYLYMCMCVFMSELCVLVFLFVLVYTSLIQEKIVYSSNIFTQMNLTFSFPICAKLNTFPRVSLVRGEQLTNVFFLLLYRDLLR